MVGLEDVVKNVSLNYIKQVKLKTPFLFFEIGDPMERRKQMYNTFLVL